jgi:hypothetical protein
VKVTPNIETSPAWYWLSAPDCFAFGLRLKELYCRLRLVAIAAENTTEIVIMPEINRLQKWSPGLDVLN